LCCCLWLV